VGIPAQGSAKQGISALIGLLTTEAIVTNSADGRQRERLATSWTWSPDRTVLHMALRKDVFFHDGTKLTPEVVAQSLRDSVAAQNQFSFSSVSGVTVSGPDTIDIKLKAPDSFLLPDLSLESLVMPGHREIGTGPFKLVKSGDQSVLSAFDQYYRGRPGLTTIEVDFYPTQRNAWAAMLRGELGMLYEVSRDAEDFVKAETTLRTYSFPRTYYIPFVFNIRHPVLRNKEVRLAINEALDRDALIKDGLRGRGKPADTPIWPGHWAYTDSREKFSFNPDAARRRLEAAGFPIKPGVNGSMPSRFSITCVVLNDSRFERLSLLLQRQLAEVGIDLKLVPETARGLQGRLGKGDFDVLLYEMAGRSLTWVYGFWHSGKFIDTGYSAGDATLDRIRAAGSDDEIRSGVADLMRVFHDDPPAAFLAWQVTARAVSTGIDVEADSDRDILTNVWQWHPVSPAKQASR
jgi:peptide/nickel transport system substrate-binding protein